MQHPTRPEARVTTLTFRALILQGYETGDTSEVIRTFSGAAGRLSVMCKGLRNPKNRMAGVLQPLSTVELTVSWREGAEMATLREAASVDDRAALRGDLERLALGFLLAEAASEAGDVGQPSEHSFAVLESGLAALHPASPRPAPTSAAHHLLRLLTLAGYEPHIAPELLRPWPTGQPKPAVFWLDVTEGTVRAGGAEAAPEWPFDAPADARTFPLPPEAVRAIHRNLETADEELVLLPAIDSARANQLIDGLCRLLGWHLGRPLRSARFWRGIALR